MKRNVEDSLAYSNGVACYKAKRPMDKCNPYAKNDKNHERFILGYKYAQSTN